MIAMTKESAASRIQVLQSQLEAIEDEMVQLALEFNIELYIDGKGWLLLEDNDWSGKYRGDWYTSTDSCS